MEYVYAALILHKLGKEINEENIAKVISAAGVEPNQAKIKALVAALSEVNIDEALKSVTSLPITTTTVQPTSQPVEEKKEKVEEEKKKEAAQEEAVEGLAALFG
ncbi:MAG: 50S ribosomal protein P1 [Nitrososphaeria archaeon]|nr:50S ribosomal protein P1 [Nitrososphaeria archaeon]